MGDLVQLGVDLFQAALPSKWDLLLALLVLILVVITGIFILTVLILCLREGYKRLDEKGQKMFKRVLIVVVPILVVICVWGVVSLLSQF